MARVRRDLGQRFENEAPLVHRRMWDHKLRGVNDGRAKQNDIDVDRACALDAGALLCRIAAPPEAALDRPDAAKQLLGHTLGLKSYRAIQEVWLLRVADR